jgi:hypothetical protein
MGEMGVCPVCRKPFAQSISDLPFLKKQTSTMTKEQRQRRQQLLIAARGGRVPASSPKLRTTVQRLCPQSENEAVVVTKCGHVFHKFCLRNYCLTFKT